jgi:hypothetical protein
MTGISVSGESLAIDRNALSIDDFTISCSARNKKYSGTSTKIYTTSMKLKNVQV